MGAQSSHESFAAHPLIQGLLDDRLSNDGIKWSELSSLPQLHPTLYTQPELKQSLTATCELLLQRAEKTQRVGALCRAVCSSVSGHIANKPGSVPYGNLCNQLLVLQVVVETAHTYTKGDPHRLAEVLQLKGQAPQHAGHVVVETMVSFLLHHQVLNLNQGCIAAHSLALAVLTAACAAPLWLQAESLAELGGVPGATLLIDHVTDHPEAPHLVRSLLQYVMKADFPPPAGGERGAIGAFLDLASYVVSPFARRPQPPAGGGGGGGAGVGTCDATSLQLGRRAALLLCVLLQWRKNVAKTHPTFVMEAFRAEDDESFPVENLYELFCRPGTLHYPELALLFYSLLVENGAMLDHVLAAHDIARLVVPIAHVLHHAEALAERPATLYLHLSTLLVLSQYRRFNAAVHAAVVPPLGWASTGGALRDLTAGSLLVLKLIRVVHFVQARRDEYATRQVFSIIANMGCEITRLHESPSEQMRPLVRFLARLACKKTLDADVRAQHLECLRNVVSCLARCLRPEAVEANIALLYEMLRWDHTLPEVLQGVRKHCPEDAVLISTLEALGVALTHYTACIHKATEGINPDVATVTEALRAAVGEQWASPLASVPPPDRYGYAEGPTPEAFFVPYSWELVLCYYGKQCGMSGWSIESLPLFAEIYPPEDESDGRATPTAKQVVQV